MTQVFKNNASSRLVLPVAKVDTTLRLLPGEGERFPQPSATDWFMVTVEDRRTGQIEICRCDARNQDILTVTRGQEGTNVQDFAIGATVSNRLTAKTLNDYLSDAFTKNEADPFYVNVEGDTMTGPLVLMYLPGDDALNPREAVNKDYVDRRLMTVVSSAMWIGDGPPSSPFHGQEWWESDTGNHFIYYDDGDSSQWVQINIDSASSAAPLFSPAFTGDPTTPTPPVGDDDLSVANTAWVKLQGYARIIDIPPSETAASILTKLLTVDGAASGLDADLLDGQDSAFFLNANNLNAGTVGNARLPGRIQPNSNVYGTSDLNSFLESGWYPVMSASPNMPVAGQSGVMQVIARYDHIFQIFYRSTAAFESYFRISLDIGVTWSAWAKIPDVTLMDRFYMRNAQYGVSTSSSGAPSTGSIRCGTAVPASVTTLTIHNVDLYGIDRASKLLGRIKTGAQILLEDVAPTTDWAEFKVTGPTVNMTTYVSVPVSLIAASATMPFGTSIMSITPAPAP